MSQENVEIIRRALEAFNLGDLEAVTKDFAGPKFEYVASGALPGARGVYRGADGYRTFLEAEGLFAEFDEVQVEIDELVESGDQVLVSLTLHGRGRQSGVEASWRVFMVWTVQD